MKKIMLFLICTAGLLSMCVACYDENYHEGHWYIKNCTDQTLILAHRTTYLKRIYYQGLAPEDSVKIQTFEFHIVSGETPYFDCLFKYWSDPEEGYSVLSKDSVLLKEWRRGDNKFFNESYWHYYERQGMSYDKPNIVATWVFDVLPEDIVQEP